MRNEDLIVFLVMISVLVLIVIALLAIVAGNIVNDLFYAVPSIGGPLGAAVALVVFVGSLLKLGEMMFK